MYVFTIVDSLIISTLISYCFLEFVFVVAHEYYLDEEYQLV
jgi:hypothetical protein